MDAIKTYLDNVFAAFPQTDEVLAMKRNMLASMEEKYYELKRENKSEEDAVGSIISNFGNIDEIAAELGIAPGGGDADTSGTITLTDDEAREFLKEWRRGGVFIGFGVWAILMGVGAMVFFVTFAVALGMLAMMTGIALGTALFITTGIRMSPYEKYQRHKIILSVYMRSELEKSHKNYLPRFGAQTAAGVAATLMGVGLMIAFTIMGAVFFAVALLLGMIGFSTFLFIVVGHSKSSFDILLK